VGGDISYEDYHTAKDESRMEIDTSSAAITSPPKREEVKKPTENGDDWQRIKQMQSGPSEAPMRGPESNVSF